MGLGGQKSRDLIDRGLTWLGKVPRGLPFVVPLKFLRAHAAFILYFHLLPVIRLHFPVPLGALQIVGENEIFL